jgi:hypothetical protein
MTVHDRASLEHQACASYQIIRESLERLNGHD